MGRDDYGFILIESSFKFQNFLHITKNGQTIHEKHLRRIVGDYLQIMKTLLNHVTFGPCFITQTTTT